MTRTDLHAVNKYIAEKVKMNWYRCKCRCLKCHNERSCMRNLDNIRLCILSTEKGRCKGRWFGYKTLDYVHGMLKCRCSDCNKEIRGM